MGTSQDATRLLRRAEVAERLNVSVRTIDRLVRAGDLPVVRVTQRRPRFLVSDVQELIRSRRTIG